MIHFFVDYGESFPFKEAGTRLSINAPDEADTEGVACQ